MRIRVAHLYPEYLNIYADRGNIAVLESRARWRGVELDVEQVSLGDELRPGAHDLLYIGGGQDREQALIAPDLAARGEAIGRRSPAGRRCSRCAAATSCSGASTGAATAKSFRGPACFRSRPWQASGA